MQTIRQQTQLRSPLIVAAERGLNTPNRYKPRRPQPLGFLIDGTACTDDNLTARFPRSSREAFGHNEPAPGRITFLQRSRSGWAGIAAAVLMLAFVILWRLAK
jgi:hypothetical protein